MVDKGHKILTSDTRLNHLHLQLSLTFSCLDADTQFFNSFTWQHFPENLLCSKENIKNYWQRYLPFVLANSSLYS